MVQQQPCRLNLALTALSKDARRSLCVGTTNNTGKENKNDFSVQMRQVNNTTEALMLIL